MSAGLTEHDSMFSVRAVPWHGLGAVLERPPASVAAIGERTRRDACVAPSDPKPSSTNRVRCDIHPRRAQPAEAGQNPASAPSAEHLC
jgi:hypothetical protein